MKKRYRAIGSAILMGASTTQAADFSEIDLTWHGFFTAGATFSDSPTTYSEHIDDKGTFSDSRFGLNVSTVLPHDWQIAGQLISHDGDASVYLDWG